MVRTSRADQLNVLELSSFQLETTETFRAHVGAALNVTPDHLDRHYTLENYAEAKARLFVNQRAADFAVLNHDDAITRAYANRTKGAAVWFSSTRDRPRAHSPRSPRIFLHAQPLMESSEVPLRGTHNIENTMAAAASSTSPGATHAQIRAAVMTFPGVEHRLEFVRDRNGVAWYNDSKATNVDAALKAIAAFSGGLWVILGGKDKNSDYTPLAAPLKQKSHAALLIGAAAEKIRAQLGGEVRMIACRTLETAVHEARARAASGDTVLLAPACASFDQFENYEHRGREFKRLVRALMAKLKTDWVLFLTVLSMVGFRLRDPLQLLLRGRGAALQRRTLLFRGAPDRIRGRVLSDPDVFQAHGLPAAEHARMGIFRAWRRAGAARIRVFRRPAHASLV